jgi:hypothetical protein
MKKQFEFGRLPERVWLVCKLCPPSLLPLETYLAFPIQLENPGPRQLVSCLLIRTYKIPGVLFMGTRQLLYW